MLAREYNRKIEIWHKTYVVDEFGGNVETNILVKSIWTKIKTNAGNKFVNYGIQDFKNPVIFSVRGIKNDIVYNENHFVRYGEQDYFIKGVEDVNVDGQELNLYCDGI